MCVNLEFSLFIDIINQNYEPFILILNYRFQFVTRFNKSSNMVMPVGLEEAA